MAIIRAARPESAYTIIRNDVLRDERCSFRARGILAYILSHSDNWRTDVETLSRVTKEGREAVATAMKELRAAGYIVQSRSHNATTGRWIVETTVYDTPQGADYAEAQATARPARQAATMTATRLVAEIWEPVAVKSAQAPVAVVRIITTALNRGIAEHALSIALAALALRGETITTSRLNAALNGAPVRGQLAADTTDWSTVAAEVSPTGELAI